jgi:tetratricopeptide (TPR) repeat protein
MFKILKKDVHVGDRIRLYLTSSSEKPEGIVRDIGENYVLLEKADASQGRFFDRIIAGWDILTAMPKSPVRPPQLVPASEADQLNYVGKLVSPATNPGTEKIDPIKRTEPPKKSSDVQNFSYKYSSSPDTVRRTPLSKPAFREIVIQGQIPESKVGSPFLEIEKKITALIQHADYEQAMRMIDENLAKSAIDDKYKSSFLLKKAQLYSTLQKPEESEKIYRELIHFNENSGEPKTNIRALSHYYTELARLQSLRPEKLPLAIESAKKAINYNPNNNFSRNLLLQLENRQTMSIIPDETIAGLDLAGDEADLQVDEEDTSGDISPMLRIDFEEHHYTHPLIIKNGGIPTPSIADAIMKQAREIRVGDMSERYPIYLDAAKSYSELDVGSYETRNYLMASAFYARLKGDSLYYNFKNRVLRNDLALDELTRLKDSACSYYLESARLLSDISPKSLPGIFTNYLILNIVHYYLKRGRSITEYYFSGKFGDVFRNCLKNKDEILEKIAWATVIDCGAVSSRAWNRLYDLPDGTGFLYGDFSNPRQKKYIYDLINSAEEGAPIDIGLKPGKFLQAAFKKRRNNEIELGKIINNISRLTFEGRSIESIAQAWSGVSGYDKLLTATDRETEKAVDEAIKIVKPYLRRNLPERRILLIQFENMIEKQIEFINRNTTIYGRVYFFRLLSKWKGDIARISNKEIVQSRPALEAEVDPPYYLNDRNKTKVLLIIKNKGEVTAQGYIIDGVAELAQGGPMRHEFKIEKMNEIPAGGKTDDSLELPAEMGLNSNIIDLDIAIVPLYQNEKTGGMDFRFTLENEPESVLKTGDIPWNERIIPQTHLFKGREMLIDKLYHHYLSVERSSPYILYGLTRTGKSSILQYLGEEINHTPLAMRGRDMTLVAVEWDFMEAANYSKHIDFWEYLITKIHNSLGNNQKKITGSLNNEYQFKGFQDIIEIMNRDGIYPLFLVDEFSYVKTLVDKNIIPHAFLGYLRQCSLDDKAGFVFAGTYDTKELIKNEKYGITGQFVHARDEQIDKIDDKAAEDLINVIEEKLIFTSDAVKHIKLLSGNIPYFIQLICKYCGYYAVENKRRSIGYPELENVIRILTGQESPPGKSSVIRLPENVFQNNQLGTSDSKKVIALISSIAWFSRESPGEPRGARMNQLQELWARYKVESFRPALADSIQILREKKIISSEQDEGDTIYKLSVDLFRRWWNNHYPDIELALAAISE